MDGDSDVAPFAVEDVMRIEGMRGMVLTCSPSSHEIYILFFEGREKGVDQI
jgi:hypothetical protein